MSKATTSSQLELLALKSANYTDKKVSELGERVAEVFEELPDPIRYDAAQTLTDGQKAQARENIGAVAKSGISLGVHSDGLIYVFVDGSPVGDGIELATAGDVIGYVDENNNVILTGALADGTYNIKYEMENGSTVDIGDLVLDTNVYYSVTTQLMNCTINNDAREVVEGENYRATIFANENYELYYLNVRMGGVDITESAVVNGNIVNIESVTGDISITATAELAEVAEPVTTDITLRDGIRLGSDGGDRTGATGHCATERINLANIPKPCTIHLTKAKWAYATTSETGYIMTCAKNAAGTNLVVGYTNETIGSGYLTVVRNNGKNTDVTVTVTSAEVTEICFSGWWSNSEVKTDWGYEDATNVMHAEATLTYTPAS